MNVALQIYGDIMTGTSIGFDIKLTSITKRLSAGSDGNLTFSKCKCILMSF